MMSAKSGIRRLIFSSFCVLLIGATNFISAVPGDLDTTFGGDGIVTTAIGTGTDWSWAVTVDSAQNIIAAGWSDSGGDEFASLARYTPDGTLDAGFGVGGKIATDFGSESRAYAVASQSDRKIILGVDLTPGLDSHAFLARYNTDGALDINFGTDGKTVSDFGQVGVSSAVNDVAVQTDQRIIAVGSSGGDFALARFNTDGSLDSTFGTAGFVETDFDMDVDSANAVALQANGKIVLCGVTRVNNGAELDIALARYNTDGDLDTEFSDDGLVITHVSNGTDYCFDLAIQPDGKIVAAGYSNDEFLVVRYNPDGSLDTNFDGDGIVITSVTNGDDWGRAVEIQADGKIVVAGYSPSNIAIVRYNPDGSLDLGFSEDGKLTTDVYGYADRAEDMDLQADGKIVVAGKSYQVQNGHNDDYVVARYWASKSYEIFLPLLNR